MSYEDLITKQHDQRLINHPHSMKSKAHWSYLALLPALKLETSHRNKSHACNRYLLANVEGVFCNVTKFISSQLRSTGYCIKKSECYHVPGDLLGCIVTRLAC